MQRIVHILRMTRDASYRKRGTRITAPSRCICKRARIVVAARGTAHGGMASNGIKTP